MTHIMPRQIANWERRSGRDYSDLLKNLFGDGDTPIEELAVSELDILDIYDMAELPMPVELSDAVLRSAYEMIFMTEGTYEHTTQV
jgi:hypothetical protein